MKKCVVVNLHQTVQVFIDSHCVFGLLSRELGNISCCRVDDARQIIFLQVDDELEIKAYYAGHVLGAAMFQVKVGQNSVVYTVSVTIIKINVSVRCPFD